ncbi:MAG: branched-chain amino acid transport system II carrier protein [Acutalibacteraceae bacterium]|nr:branched-chain amino acid transport system II carrier protein [Acutalibacteraceae bacterium]
MSKDFKKYLIDGFLIGSALFSMFFGAGNMIFPPYLGFKAGNEWLLGFISYFIADIGLALIAVFALIKTSSNNELLRPLGKIPAFVLMFSVFMCIGPLITIPRTAATTYELAIAPLGANFSTILFYIIFFTVVFLLCYNKSAVVDIVGKFLTPLLFLGLVFLIVLGIINGAGNIDTASRSQNIVADGIEAGYQSMDVLGAMVFGILVLNSFKEKGYNEPHRKLKIFGVSGLVAGGGLLVIYLGLTFLGASVAQNYTMHISRTELLINIINTLIPGKTGIIFFGIIAGLACLSTAIALTSAAAEYLCELTKGKISYKAFVVIICVFDIAVSLLGVEGLITLASPILNLIYPPILITVILSLFKKHIGVFAFRLSAAAAFIFAFIDVLNFRFIYKLPLSRYGFAWVLPTAALLGIGLVIDKISHKKRA